MHKNINQRPNHLTIADSISGDEAKEQTDHYRGKAKAGGPEDRRTGQCSKMGPSTRRRDRRSRDDASTATGAVNHRDRSHFLLAVEIMSLSARFNDWFNCRACPLPPVGVISHQHPGNLAQAIAASRISGHMSVINSAVIKNMSVSRRLLICVPQTRRSSVLASLWLQPQLREGLT